MMQEGEPYISEMGKTNGALATSRDDHVDSGKDTKAFWYWLGYWDGQNSILNAEQKTVEKEGITK